MIDINNIKGLQELFKEKLFEIASTEKVVKDIYPIVRLANVDINDDTMIWNLCAELVNAVNEYELYKLYTDKFHYSFFYDFEEDQLLITEIHKDNNNMMREILNRNQCSYNLYKSYYTILDGDYSDIIFKGCK